MVPANAHSGLIPGAAASMATVLTCLWIADRLLSPILELERCRREVHASLVVATSLTNNVARLAGRGDVDGLNALRDTKRRLARKADQVAFFRTRQSLSLRLYIGIRGYDLAGASRGLMRLAVSLLAPRRQRLIDRAAVEASLKIAPGDMA
jgi:hypothetical protein